jgi:hypothetical protein
MLERRSSFGAAAFNGCIYVGAGIVGGKELKSVEIFDPKVGAWRQETSLPARSWALCMIAV